MRRTLIVTLMVGSLLATSAGTAFGAQWVQFRYDAAQSGINPDETAITVANADTWQVDWELYPTPTRRYTTAPIVTEDAVIVGGSKIGTNGLPRATIWSFDIATGSVNWVRPLTCTRVKAPSMALSQGRSPNLVIATLTGCGPTFPGDRVAFVNVTSGTHDWTNTLTGNVGPPTLDGSKVVLNNAGEIAVIDIGSGPRIVSDIVFINEAFQSSGTKEPWPVIGSDVYTDESSLGGPAVSNGVVVTNSREVRTYSLADGSLTALYSCGEEVLACAIDQTTHEVLWTKPPSELLSSMLVVGDVVYHVCDATGTGLPEETLCAFDLQTGSPLWIGEGDDLLALGQSRGWRPIYAGGIVFVGGFDTVSGESAVVGFDAATGDVVTTQVDGTPWGDYYNPGGKYMAVVNGLLVTAVPAIRVTSFG
jgi:outer membrane protein assembly factor BamB